jgi:4-methylaminobutanoate oxidase (formaldehyde-forming)
MTPAPDLREPTEEGARLWSALWEEGRPRGVLAGGYRAIDSLRLEKGYRVWGADITPDETPLEAALGFCVRMDKTFLGSDALEEPHRRLRCLVLADPCSLALGNEPVRNDGRVVGRVTTGGYGYSVERSIAYAYLPAEVEIGTAVEVDVFGSWVGVAERRARLRAWPAVRSRRRRRSRGASRAGA